MQPSCMDLVYISWKCISRFLTEEEQGRQCQGFPAFNEISLGRAFEFFPINGTKDMSDVDCRPVTFFSFAVITFTAAFFANRTFLDAFFAFRTIVIITIVIITIVASVQNLGIGSTSAGGCSATAQAGASTYCAAVHELELHAC